VWEVKPRGGVWVVQRQGTAHADSLHRDHGDAIARGDELARRYAGRLRIRGRAGVLLEERAFEDGATAR
jgi:hypothetical protein